VVRLYQVLAECVLGLHLAFILWVAFGAFVVHRLPRLRWLHVPCLVWGVMAELTPWPCPLTLLENWLEVRAGVEPYHAGFLLHYLDKLVYPDIPPTLLTVVGVIICLLNLGYYGRALLMRRGAL
jgi:hypothetical protein